MALQILPAEIAGQDLEALRHVCGQANLFSNAPNLPLSNNLSLSR